MGASAWHYIVPFHPNLVRVLEELRQQIFNEQEYYFQAGDDGLPSSIEELMATQAVQEEGTHSILDIFQVIDPDDADDYGTLRPLHPAELRRYFDTESPTRAVFERAYASSGAQALSEHGQRWSGYSAVLHDDAGAPAQIAIWGYSGD